MSAPTSRLYAQTNVQLYDQMSSAGYSRDDLAAIQRAYEAMQPLFSGSFRGSGRPFLAHLVGTASILADAGQPIAVIVAGLCHAAYEFGDFGASLRRRSSNNRQKLRQWIGTEAETLVWSYSHLEWSIDAISGYPDDQADKQVLVIRLANEIEDALIDNWFYSGSAKRKSSHDTAKACRELAARLDLTEWQEALDELIKEQALLMDTAAYAADNSYVLPATSYRLSLKVHLARVAKKVYHLFHGQRSE